MHVSMCACVRGWMSGGGGVMCDVFLQKCPGHSYKYSLQSFTLLTLSRAQRSQEEVSSVLFLPDVL